MGNLLVPRLLRCGALTMAVLILAGCAAIGGPDRLEPLRLNQAAMDAYQAENWPLALDLHRELAASGSASARGWYRLANLEARDGDLDAALLAYRRSLEIDPDLAEARHNLGMVHLRIGADALREARPQMRRRGAAGASDGYMVCLLAEVVEAVDLSEACGQLASP